MKLPLIDDYRQLFLQDRPLLDVRAPVEFAAGSFPLAQNEPLIDDDERHQIGIRYKEDGQDAAVDLGNRLVHDSIKEARIQAWKDFAEQYPNGALYCFRGGMRSRVSQQWLYEETGISYPRIEGGYKALRRFLIDELAAAADDINPVVIGGRTGAGKTLLLRKVENKIDLERLAHHRGSAFGRHATEQPTQIDFENNLSIELIKHRASENRYLFVEDEGKSIGSRHLPETLFEKFRNSPLVVLEVGLEERIENTVQEYIVDTLHNYQQLYGQQNGFRCWADYLLNSIDRIKKRLGEERHRVFRGQMAYAIERQRLTGEINAHHQWIEGLLIHYYDPMYNYQISKNKERIVMQGSFNELIGYLSQYN